mmetsp:Transcript_8393/g.16725  ORF Transcript_8393/g.16725 Transcript_8393/m.16725 type:complete len:205 (-) Transcript_8393:18-632(-)
MGLLISSIILDSASWGWWVLHRLILVGHEVVLLPIATTTASRLNTAAIVTSPRLASRTPRLLRPLAIVVIVIVLVIRSVVEQRNCSCYAATGNTIFHTAPRFSCLRRIRPFFQRSFLDFGAEYALGLIRFLGFKQLDDRTIGFQLKLTEHRFYVVRFDLPYGILFELAEVVGSLGIHFAPFCNNQSAPCPFRTAPVDAFINNCI